MAKKTLKERIAERAAKQAECQHRYVRVGGTNASKCSKCDLARIREGADPDAN